MVRVALLTNFVPPYRVPVLEAVGGQLDSFRILVSTAMEANRRWLPADSAELPIHEQRTWTLRRGWRDSVGFREPREVHLPISTWSDLGRFRPDVIVSSELGWRSWLSVLYGRVQDVPVIAWATLSEQSEASRGRTRAISRRILLNLVDACVTNGESGARYLIDAGLAPDKVVKVNQATAHVVAKHTKRAGQQRPVRLLFVGQVVERKGLALAIEALARHSSSGYELRVVGDGDEREVAESLADHLGVPAEWVGFVEPGQLGGHYDWADFLVFPTLADEWGLVVNEAMSAGVPVLGSIRAQAVQELVHDGRNGLVFDPLRQGELAEVIERALGVSAEEWLRMSAAARASVAGLTPEAMAEQIVSVVHRVWSRRSRRPMSLDEVPTSSS
jgi:glycosyltransferase involved in cell wall biosynthesis